MKTNYFEDNISEFIKGYIACALWSTTTDEDVPFDAKYEKEDIVDSSLFLMVIDCYNFYHENYELWDGLDGYNSSRAGHDFWLTRNGHGVGFWDRDELPTITGELLTAEAEKCGEVYLYVGDDGGVYYS